MKTPANASPARSTAALSSLSMEHEENSLGALRRLAAWSNDHDALTALGLVCAWACGLLALTL